MSDVFLRQSFLRRLLAGVFCGLLVSGTAQASMPVAPDQLILRLSDSPASDRDKASTLSTAPSDAGRLSRILSELGAVGVKFQRSLGGNMLVVILPDDLTESERQDILGRLAAHPEVAYTEPDRIVRPAFTPNDPLRSLQWFHYEEYGIRAYDAWDELFDRAVDDSVIALVDSGILPHQDILPSRILPGYDFVSIPSHSGDPIDPRDGDGWDSNPHDEGNWTTVDNECGDDERASPSNWHGLHLAGVMIAQTNNWVGVAGIDHYAKLLPVRVLGKCGGRSSDVIAAIQWAAGLPVVGTQPNVNPARVINLSFGGLGGGCTSAIQEAINRVVATGAVVVAAAGNDERNDVADTWPAGCDNVIAVSATDRAGRIAGYSNVGARVLLSAPGGDGQEWGPPGNAIYSTYNTGSTTPALDGYVYSSGTSVAAAQVSAAVSLLLSVQPALTQANIRQILAQTAWSYSGGCPTGLPCGAGILNMHAALKMALEIVPGDPVAASGGSGGGGGGGCVLVTGSGRGADLGWLLVLAFLGLLRVQSMRR